MKCDKHNIWPCSECITKAVLDSNEDQRKTFKESETVAQFKSKWAEKVHELLDECGFEKDNQEHPEIPSTTKRSEALALQALLLVFVLEHFDLIRKEE